MKGRFRKKELNGIKILTEKHDETKITYWMTTGANNNADIIFKLRYEEEKRLGVDNSQLSQFK